MIRDLRLRDAIAQLPAEPWAGTVYRTCWRGRNVLQGSSGGGRWSPRNGFEIIYTSLDKDGAIAEIDAWLSEIYPRPDRPIDVHEIEVETGKTITIEDFDGLAALGVDITCYGERLYDRSQQIGDVANFLGCDGLIVPSARWSCLNLVLLVGNHQGDDQLRSVGYETVDWERWHREHRT